MVKKTPAHEGDVREAGSMITREDPLQEEMATHSSNLAWRIPATEESGGLQFIGSQRVRQTWHARTAYFWCVTSHSWFFVCTREPASLLPRHGNGPSEAAGLDAREGAESALHPCSSGTEMVGAPSAPEYNCPQSQGSQGPVVLTEPVRRSSA